MEVPFKFKISEVPATARKSWIWITINLIGLIFYLYFTLQCWPMSNNGELVETTNIGISWGITCLPILILMFLANLIWLLMNLLRKSRPAVFVWLVMVIVWVCVVSFEFHIRNLARMV